MDNDDRSVESTADSVRKLKKDLKLMKKNFSTVNTQLTQLNEVVDGSDLSDSVEYKEDSHFQLEFAQVEHNFEPRIATILNLLASHESKTDLTQVILLNNQSTMDLFCNKSLVSTTFESKTPMRLKSNGGTMKFNHKATINGYQRQVWFSKNAITNIIALKNIIWQYRVTYDSDESTFVVHRDAANKKNMEFRMHANSLYCYGPREDITEFAFLETVAGNKKGFTKR